MTDSEIQTTIDRYESAQRYAQSIQTDGRDLYAANAVFSATIGRVSKVIGAIVKVGGKLDDDISSLGDEIAATSGQVEAMAFALVDANNVMSSRQNDYPFGGYSVQPSVPLAVNFDGDPENDIVPGYYTLWDGSTVLAGPTLEDAIRAALTFSTSQSSDGSGSRDSRRSGGGGTGRDTVSDGAGGALPDADGNGQADSDFDNNTGSGTYGGGGDPFVDSVENGNMGDTGSGSPVVSPDQPPGAFPVILDLDGDGVEVNASARVNFDWDGDGFQESGNWAARNRNSGPGLWRAAA